MAKLQKGTKMKGDAQGPGRQSVSPAISAISKAKSRLRARNANKTVPTVVPVLVISKAKRTPKPKPGKVGHSASHVVLTTAKPKLCRSRPIGSYHVDTKGMCLLCYRERNEKLDDLKPATKKRTQEFSARFCKLILRYLKLEFQQSIAKPSNLELTKRRLKKIKIELCEDCSLLAGNFCKMYTELETMRMRLDACVKSIADIMSLAGRIPSRIKAYQERMGVMMNGEGVHEKGCGSKNVKSRTDVASKTVTVAQNFRKELILKCSEKYKSTYPRVRLRDFNKPRECSTVTNQALIAQAGPSRKNFVQNTLPQPPSSLHSLVLAYSSIALVSYLANIYRESSGAVRSSKSKVATSKAVNDTLACTSGTGVVSTDSAMTNHQDAIESRRGESTQTSRRNSMTITDCGKTIMLLQTVKTEEMFVDESEAFVEGEDYCEMSLMETEDISGDAEATAAAGTTSPSKDNPDSAMDMVEDERSSHNSVMIDINDKTCRECNFQLSCRAELEKHRVQIHKLEKYVECPRCKEMLPNHFVLKRHRELSEVCAIPEETEILEFDTIAKPIFPYAPTVRGNKFCPLEGCFEVFANDGALELHLKTHGSYPCNYCSQKFEKAHDLALHETQKHSEQLGFKCMRCNFHVGSQYSYLLHFLSTHLNIAVYQERCEICQRGFNNSNERQAHLLSHHDTKGKLPEDIFKCTICHAPFLKKFQLRRHLQHEHHVEQQAKFMCNLCLKSFVTMHWLQKHKLKDHEMLTDHEVKVKLKRKTPMAKRTKEKCEYCGLTFVTKASLLLHELKHKNELQQKGDPMQIEQSIAPLETPQVSAPETPPKTPSPSVPETSTDGSSVGPVSETSQDGTP